MYESFQDDLLNRAAKQFIDGAFSADDALPPAGTIDIPMSTQGRSTRLPNSLAARTP